MAETFLPAGDPRAIKRYSASLFVDTARDSYFTSKFMASGEAVQTPLQMLSALENDAGDTVTYDLLSALKMAPIEGDDKLRGKEEPMSLWTDEVKINQMRSGVSAGGAMTRKRTIIDLRMKAKPLSSEWWARVYDELVFMYQSGGRGTNADYIFPLGYAGFAGNAFVAPDAQHLIYGGDATAKANVDAGDVMSLSVIDRAKVKTATLGGGSTGVPRMQPCKINGESVYVCVMHPWQGYSLRNNNNTGQWLDIQKSLTTAIGNSKGNPLFVGGLGMYNGVVLHEHQAVTQYTDYGAGGNVAAARALFMGRQAGVLAFGSPGTGLRMKWHEEMDDHDNEVLISSSAICGTKKTAFTISGTSYDFGQISIDTAAANPG